MKQVILILTLLTIVTSGCGQAIKEKTITIEDFAGKWLHEFIGEIEAQSSSFGVILEKDSTQENALIGWHCSVVRGGRKTDCADKESGEEPSLRGGLRGDTLYLHFRSSWEVEGEAKLYFDRSAQNSSVLIWELGKTEYVGKVYKDRIEHYMPEKETLQKLTEQPQR